MPRTVCAPGASAVFLVSLAVTLGSGLIIAARLPGSSRPAQAPTQERVRVLMPGNAIEHHIGRGETHRYVIALAAGQCARIVVEQRGTDLALSVTAPDGSSRLEIDGRWDGPEAVPVIASAPGSYEIQVQTVEHPERPRSYAIIAGDVKAATPQDVEIVTALRASTEAKALIARGTAAALRDAIALYDGMLPTLRSMNEVALEAQTLNSLGFVHNALSDQKQALERYRNALRLWPAIGDTRGEAETTHNVAAVYSAMGDRRQALKTYQDALHLRRSAGDTRGESTTLTNLGSIAYAIGDNRAALDYASQAIAGFRAFEDRRGEAFAQNVIGSAYTALGEYQEALDRYAQVLALMEGLDERGVAAGHTNMGTLHFSLGDNPTALDHLNRALTLFRKAGDRRSEARVLINIGRGYEGERALKHYADALPIAKAVGDRNAEALALNNIASVHYANRDAGTALNVADQALVLMRETGDKRGEAGALNNVGSALLLLDRPAEAVARFTAALALMKHAEDRSGEAATLYNITRAERLAGDLDNARRHIEEATGIIESIRTKVVSQDLRAFFFATKRDYYDEFVDLLMALHERRPSDGFDRAALQVCERGRARGLLETLLEAHANIREGVDEALVTEERRVQEQINSKADSLRRMMATPHLPTEETAIRSELDGLLARYREIGTSIRIASPRYAALTQPEPLAITELQELLAKDTLLLEYSLGAERSYVWAVTRTTFASFALAPKATIESAARRVYDAWQRGGQQHAEAEQEAAEAAGTLSRLILAPVAHLLEDKRILVVADGGLQYVPFAPLPSPSSGKPGSDGRDRVADLLIFHHEIGSLPAASVLHALRRAPANRPIADQTVAILADPVFETDDSRVSRGRAASPSVRSNSVPDTFGQLNRSAVDTGAAGTSVYIPRLPFSKREADHIAGLAPRSSLKALGFAASRATATSASLARYRFIHFATHALINTVHPELTGVVLSLVNERGEPQDGFLRLHDIYNLRLPVELVVLSACQTALGQEVRGEGLVGLTRGFMYAGASRVAVALWKVDDEATAELMRLFYANMLGRSRLRPAAALRSAQIALMQQKRWKLPYFWAAFVLQGDHD